MYIPKVGNGTSPAIAIANLKLIPCRGLPLGYLNQLEQRLVATESALYGALATLQSVRPTTVIQAWPNPESVHKPKSARMDEWSQLPLRGWSDMDRWQAAVSDQFVVGHAQGISVDTPRSAYTIPVTPSQNDAPTPSVVAGQRSSDGYAWQSRSEIPMRFSCGAHAPAPMDGSSPSGYSRDRATAVSDGVASPGGYPQNHRVTPGDSGGSQFADTRQSSRAEALSQSNPGIYF